jgi:hypothetical protein
MLQREEFLILDKMIWLGMESCCIAVENQRHVPLFIPKGWGFIYFLGLGLQPSKTPPSHHQPVPVYR